MNKAVNSIKVWTLLFVRGRNIEKKLTFGGIRLDNEWRIKVYVLGNVAIIVMLCEQHIPFLAFYLPYIWIEMYAVEFEPRGVGGGGLDISLGPCLKTKIADFPTLFKTEFRFLIPFVRQKSLIIVNIIRLFIVQEKIPCLRQKLIKSVPCLRQKSRKTYPDWPHVPIKPW